MKNYEFLENMINIDEQREETEYYYLEENAHLWGLGYSFYDGNLDLILKEGEIILEKIENVEIEEVLEVAKKYLENYEDYKEEKCYFYEFFKTKEEAYKELNKMYKNNLVFENQLIHLIEILDEIEAFLNDLSY